MSYFEDEIVDIDGENEEMVDIETPMAETPNFPMETTPAPEIKREQTQEPMPPPPPPEPATPSAVANAPLAQTTGMATRRSTRANLTQPVVDGSERTTRSQARPRLTFQPKLKLKVNERQASGMSFLGTYDRELDSDDEDLAFEEQFILRMPPGEDCERLREMVEKREISKDVYFKFKGMTAL